MIRLAVALARRGRVQLPIWILAITVLWLISARAISTEFADEQLRRDLFGIALLNPAIIALRGRPDGLDLDALVFFQVFTFVAVLTALANTFLATRGVRGDEEPGRLEAVLAAPVRRTSPLAATLLVGIVVDVLIGAGSALALIGSGFDPAGAAWAGAATGATGLAFLGLGSLAGQLMPTARAANSTGVALVLAAWVLRAVGDATGTADVASATLQSAWPSWLSPIGWAQQVSPFGDPQPGPLVLLLGLAVLASGAALAVQSRRDLGASLVRERAGRPRAARWLASPLALAWRMQRGALLGWAVGGALFGVIAGAVSDLVRRLSADADGIRQIIDRFAPGAQTDLQDAFVVAVLSIAGVLAAAAGVQAVLRLRGEEVDGLAEPVLATPVTRPGRLLAWVAVAAASGGMVALAAGSAAALSFAVVDPDADRTGSSLLGGVAQLPGVAFFVGVAALAVAVLPRAAAALAWGALIASYLLGPIGGLLGLDDDLRVWSPFEQVPAVPGDTPDWTGALVVAVVGIVAMGVALIAMRRRELST